MTRTRMVTARLPNGDTKRVKATWCSDARWYKARVDGTSVYFERDGTQV